MKMTTDEARVMNMFIDFYDELSCGKLIQGCTGVTESREVQTIIAGIASTLTIYKILKEESK